MRFWGVWGLFPFPKFCKTFAIHGAFPETFGVHVYRALGLGGLPIGP